MSDFGYYSWFNKTINIFIYCFYVCALISNLFVFCSFINGVFKYIAVLMMTILLFLFFRFFKERIKEVINKTVDNLRGYSRIKLLLIIIAVSVILKTLYSIFFYFDTTAYGGDITIYANIAESIFSEGLDSVKDYIYYLVGMGIHLTVFKKLSLPYHVGMFIVFLIGTIINYISFGRLIGKERSFLLILLYILMPSTSLLTFCITHELFGYLYFSIILYLITCFIYEKHILKEILLAVLIALFVALNGTISPMGKIWFIVLAILIMLTNLNHKKKIILAVILMLSFFTSNYLSTRLEGNTQSQSNNYEQLLIGSDLNSMGRHTDGRGKNAAREYWEARGVELTYDNLVEGEKGALIEQYKYLITHPVDLFVLLANKFYVVWSGDYYSIEFAYLCGSINTPTYYLMLLLSALIWLLMMVLSVVYYVKKEENIYVDTYKLIILGIMAVLLITEVTNKYSCYMTMFIYFVAVARTDLGGQSDE